MRNAVLVAQDGGSLSSNSKFVSYLQCSPGEFAEDGQVPCEQCPLGSYSDDVGANTITCVQWAMRGFCEEGNSHEAFMRLHCAAECEAEATREVLPPPAQQGCA